MKARMRELAIALALFAMAAADAAPPQAKAPSALASAAFFEQAAADAEQQAGSSSAAGVDLPPDLMRKEVEDLSAYIRWQREFARKSWDWHLFSTKLLMYAVLAIVLSGLVLTYMQFTRDGRKAARTEKRGSDGQAQQPNDDKGQDAEGTSKLRLGPDGVEITSQVVGLLVLGFSLAFFYLYVNIVYPMQEVELQKHAQSVEAPALPADTSKH